MARQNFFFAFRKHSSESPPTMCRSCFEQPSRKPNQFLVCRDTAPKQLSSRNAVSFSSVVTTNLFPWPRCASAIQIVRPLELAADLLGRFVEIQDGIRSRRVAASLCRGAPRVAIRTATQRRGYIPRARLFFRNFAPLFP